MTGYAFMGVAFFIAVFIAAAIVVEQKSNNRG